MEASKLLVDEYLASMPSDASGGGVHFEPEEMEVKAVRLCS